jgi:CheY-like chemotaxis protein
VLESSGYGVLTAPNGHDGLKIVSQGAKVDLVLLDYLMPGMNGDEVAENLKAEFPALPVIAMSGAHLPERMMDTVDACVPKGQRVETLLSTISRTLAAA